MEGCVGEVRRIKGGRVRGCGGGGGGGGGCSKCSCILAMGSRANIYQQEII